MNEENSIKDKGINKDKPIKRIIKVKYGNNEI